MGFFALKDTPLEALGGKFDAIPGETTETWFNANAPGARPPTGRPFYLAMASLETALHRC